MFQRRYLPIAWIAMAIVFDWSSWSTVRAGPPATDDARSLAKSFQQIAEAAAPGLVSLEVRLKPGLGWPWWQRGSVVNLPFSTLERDRVPEWFRRTTPPADAPRSAHVGSGFLIDN